MEKEDCFQTRRSSQEEKDWSIAPAALFVYNILATRRESAIVTRTAGEAMIDLPLDGFGAAVVAFDGGPVVGCAVDAPVLGFAVDAPVIGFAVDAPVIGFAVDAPVGAGFVVAGFCVVEVASIATQRRTTTATIFHIIVPN